MGKEIAIAGKAVAAGGMGLAFATIAICGADQRKKDMVLEFPRPLLLIKKFLPKKLDGSEFSTKRRGGNGKETVFNLHI